MLTEGVTAHKNAKQCRPTPYNRAAIVSENLLADASFVWPAPDWSREGLGGLSRTCPANPVGVVPAERVDTRPHSIVELDGF